MNISKQSAMLLMNEQAYRVSAHESAFADRLSLQNVAVDDGDPIDRFWYVTIRLLFCVRQDLIVQLCEKRVFELAKSFRSC